MKEKSTKQNGERNDYTCRSIHKFSEQEKQKIAFVQVWQNYIISEERRKHRI